MEKQTNGTVVSVAKQWWLKVNTKAVRLGPADGAIFPHIVKVSYTVDGREYVKRKWFPAGCPTPFIGSAVSVTYDADRPSKASVFE